MKTEDQLNEDVNELVQKQEWLTELLNMISSRGSLLPEMDTQFEEITSSIDKELYSIKKILQTIDGILNNELPF